MWETLFGLGILVLGAAFAYGISRSRRRNRGNDKVRDAAVRSQYRDPDGYDPAQFETKPEGPNG